MASTPKKHGSVWRIQVNKSGVRESGSFATRREAQDWAAKTEALALAAKQGKAPPGATFGQLLDKYAKEVSSKKKGELWESNKITHLQRQHPALCATKVEALCTRDFALWRDARLKEVTDSSVSREWTLLSRALTIAQTEWHWLDANPMKGLQRPEDAAPRDRLPSADELQALLERLGYKPAQAPKTKTQRVAWAMLWAIETAMRAKEICTLKWDNVDVTQRIAVLPVIREGKFAGKADTKTDAPRQVPLSLRALEIIEVLRSCRSAGTELVMELGSSTLDTLFRRARDALKIEDLHFHDLRAESLTRWSKKVDIMALAKISGHKDINELMTYYRETASQIAERMDTGQAGAAKRSPLSVPQVRAFAAFMDGEQLARAIEAAHGIV